MAPQADGTDHPVVRLRAVTMELASSHRDLAETLGAELEAKVEAYRGSESSSESGRRLDGTIHASPFTVDVFKLKGEIAALLEERFYLERLLETVNAK